LEEFNPLQIQLNRTRPYGAPPTSKFVVVSFSALGFSFGVCRSFINVVLEPDLTVIWGKRVVSIKPRYLNSNFESQKKLHFLKLFAMCTDFELMRKLIGGTHL
jgi:hypothetical protein